MVDFTFIFAVSRDGVEVADVEVPDEYRVAWGFFMDQRPELYANEVETIYEFVAGWSDDWSSTKDALSKSSVYDWDRVAEYLAKQASPPSLDEIRSAIVSYAQETFTSFMLQQPNPYDE